MDGKSIGSVVSRRVQIAIRIAMSAPPQSRNSAVVTNGSDPRIRKRQVRACMFRFAIHGSPLGINRNDPSRVRRQYLGSNIIGQAFSMESGPSPCRRQANPVQ
ncbi:conserved protein of unknown function [Paraburkholderia dioscoreae]|uniref:Uncharacterized protein n=1 Tax=Paraburkholderia dioscoreae TaxID=2604047 RepID=A0A5Q4YW49_9BURK|nr:conserved protein of unknown function [Paraburkholderia dioscoreae]